MAYVISDDCIACGTCIDECPVLLKLFIRDNIRSSIYDNEFRLFLFWSGLFFIYARKIRKKAYRQSDKTDKSVCFNV